MDNKPFATNPLVSASPSSGETDLKSLDGTILKDAIESAYDLDRLRDLCFKLKIRYENLPGDTLTRKTLELILYCQRYERYEELVGWVLKDNAHLADRLGVIQAPQQSSAVPGGRDLGRRPEQEAVDELGPVTQRWAFLVGINEYVEPNFANLNYCVEDVKALNELLIELGYKVIALHDEQQEERLLPTRDNVEAELMHVCELARPEDLLLVYFAGHGELVDGRPVLITREVRETKLAERALPLDWIEGQVRREAGLRRVVVLLDACHSGVEGIRGRATDPRFIENVHERAQGFALLAASTSQQKAHERQGHGVFSNFVLEGLRGAALDGDKEIVTVDSLSDHVVNGVTNFNLETGLRQKPTKRVEAYGDMILADYRSPG